MQNDQSASEQTGPDQDPTDSDRTGDNWKEVHAASVTGQGDVVLTSLVHGIESLVDQTKILRHTVQTDFTLRKVRWVIAAFIAFFLLVQDVGGYFFYTQLLDIGHTNAKSFQRIDKATNPQAQADNAKATGDIVNHIILCADNHIDVVVLHVPRRLDCPDSSNP